MNKKNSKKRRVFVAIFFPQEVYDELQHIGKVMKKAALCEGNYIKPENTHLTLQFIGEIPEQEVEEIDQALLKISYPQCEAKLGQLGAFIKKGRVAIIYVDVICPYFSTLAQLVREAVAPWVQKKEDKPFVAHGTVMRVKKVKDTDVVLSLLKDISIKPVSFMIDAFVLMESELMPEGARYHQIKKYQLK